MEWCVLMAIVVFFVMAGGVAAFKVGAPRHVRVGLASHRESSSDDNDDSDDNESGTRGRTGHVSLALIGDSSASMEELTYTVVK